MTAAAKASSESAIEHEARLVRIEGAVESLTSAVKATNANVDVVMAKLSGLGRTNWTLIIGAGAFLLSFIIPLVTVAFFITKLSTESLISPIVAEQGISKTERAENRREASENADAISSNKASIAHLIMAMGEVESQIRALENYSSVQLAAVYRDLYMIAKKTGIDYPEGPHFHPGISRQKDIHPSK